MTTFIVWSHYSDNEWMIMKCMSEGIVSKRECVSEWTNGVNKKMWVNEWCQWENVWMNEWTNDDNERMYEWMNERMPSMRERMNEWGNGCVS